MKVLRLHGRRDIRLHDEPSPEPGPGEAFIRVTAVGLCGSDLHGFAEGGIGDAVLTSPLVLGHEPVGVIAGGPRAGRRVAVDPAIPCAHRELLLRMVGADPIVATGRLPHRVAAARAMGATEAVRTMDGGVGTADDVPGPASGVDVALEAAGAGAAVESAVPAVRPGGRVVLLGIPSGDRTSFTASVARRKGITIQLCRRMQPGHLSRAIRLAQAKRVDLRSLVTGLYPPPDAEAAFAALVERRGLKVVLEPSAGRAIDRSSA